MIYRRFFKRPLDVVLSVVALVVLSPVFAVVALLVRINLGSPVIFKQERPGKDEKIFTLYKFRTMTDERDEDGELLTDDKRLTKFGVWLRSTSLDELPEFWNVLNGDMSVVGPRPLLVEYLPYYTDRERIRHNVKPGITGFAQINGRNNLYWEERFALDTKYVGSISFLLDFRILAMTIIKVVKRTEILPAGGLNRFDIARIGKIEGRNSF